LGLGFGFIDFGFKFLVQVLGLGLGLSFGFRLKNTWFDIGGSGLDRTDHFQKFCESGLDRIQFYRIRTGLGLKNFTVRLSLVCTALCTTSSHDVRINHV